MAIMLVVSVVFLVFLAGMLWAFYRTGSNGHNDPGQRRSQERAYNPGVTLGHRSSQGQITKNNSSRLAWKRPRKRRLLPVARIAKSAATANRLSPRPASRPILMRNDRRCGLPGFMGGMECEPALRPLTRSPLRALRRLPLPQRRLPLRSLPRPFPPTLIAITDSMSPEEVRKARIANAKAESAYNKALKAASSGAPVAVAGAAPAAAAQAAAPMAADTGSVPY